MSSPKKWGRGLCEPCGWLCECVKAVYCTEVLRVQVLSLLMLLRTAERKTDHLETPKLATTFGWRTRSLDECNLCIMMFKLVLEAGSIYFQKLLLYKWDSPYNNQTSPRITCRVCILLLIATVRCCWVILEQPVSSVMPWFPYLVYCQKVVARFIGWQRCTLFCPQSLMLIWVLYMHACPDTIL